MNKYSKRIIATSSGLVLQVALIAAVCSGVNANKTIKLDATNEHSITLDQYSTTIEDTSGSFNGTVIGSTAYVQFSYQGASASAGNLMALANGGQLWNPYDISEEYHNRISGLISMNVVFTGSLKVDYTWGDSLVASSPYYQRRDILITSDTPFNFFDEKPNFFRLTSVGETTIQSVQLIFSCESIGEEGTENYKINTLDELKTFRSYVNGGTSFQGQTIELGADLDLKSFGALSIGNTTSKTFKGIFDGKNHILSNYTRGNTTLPAGANLGLFANLNGGTIKNLKMANVSILATGTRNAALVSRLAGGTIENVEIISGTIKGTNECGGLVAVVVAGTTTISNCVNRANITTVGADNPMLGGIIGATADKQNITMTVNNCVNYGTIDALAANASAYSGGVIGTLRAQSGGTTNITKCSNFGDVISSKGRIGGVAGIARSGVFTNCYQDEHAKICYPDAETVLTDLPDVGSSTYGLILGGQAGATVTDCGTTLSISNQTELKAFRDTVNGGDTFENKLVALKENIILSGAFGTPIGSTGTKAFKGVFDGNNHSISNLTQNNSASAGLFFYATDATIRNVRLANVSIETSGTSARAAALVGRAENCIIDNIKIMSGTVRGIKEVGAICDVVVNGSTISNCENRASVTAKNGGAVSGIVGFLNSGSLTISNCTNYGDIIADITNTNAANAGGIIASNINGKSLVITDCYNYGNITAYKYVGGIIGIARAATSSSIDRCINYGNVTCATNALGGIAGIARIDVDSCKTASNVILTQNSTQYTAGNLDSVGELVSTDADGNGVGYLVGVGKDSQTFTGSLFTKQLSNYEGFTANSETSVNQAYGRIQVLNDGRNILTMANRFSISEAPGFTTYNKLLNRDTSISDGGFGYDYVPGYEGIEDYILWHANMEPLALDDGRLFIFYRTDAKETAIGGVYYSSIRAIESRDNGKTWLSDHHIIFENYSNDAYGDGNIRGPYEPFAVLDGDTLQIFIAFDAHATKAGGLGPDNSAFICNDYYQNLLRIPVDISNGGFSVGATSMAIKGKAAYPRPGMPSIIQLNDGSYAMILEHNGGSSYWMQVAISYSHDLISWTTPRTIIAPTKSGDIYGQRYLCGAPYIQKLNDGRIVVSYTTNEYFNPSEDLEIYGDPTFFKTVELAMSSSVVSYNSTPTMVRQNAVSYAQNYGARYGGCAVIDDKIILLINEYTFNSSYERTVGDGRRMLFSMAYYK